MHHGEFPARADSLLLEMASQQATGCLTLTEPEGDESTVWFRDGEVYSVSVPGRRPLLGVRLVSSGALSPEALAEALEVQRTDLQGWRLGELLVHLGFVDRTTVETFVGEQVCDQVADLLHWRVAEHIFANGKRTRQDISPAIEVTDLLHLAQERDGHWAEITPFIGGPDCVPVLSSSPNTSSNVVLGPYDWALLCKVDGIRSIADLADDCGFTVFEAGMVVVGLLEAGLVDIEGLDPEDGDVDRMSDLAADPRDTEAHHDRRADLLAAATGDVDEQPAFDPEMAAARRSLDVDGPSDEETVLADVVSLAHEREARDEAERIALEEARALDAARAQAEDAARAEAEDAARTQAEDAARAETERLARERSEAEELERAALEQLEQREYESQSRDMSAPVAALDGLERHQFAAMLTDLVKDASSVGEPRKEFPLPTTNAPGNPRVDLEVSPSAGSNRPDAGQGERRTYSPFDPEPTTIDPERETALAGASPRAEGADMAALLRELSSLGGGYDNEQPGQGRGEVVPRTTHPTYDSRNAKKKKGFFGR
ncbi:unannotated protein [freshwater metagenome]|uniref:Unannotated protein n=1 Tax=freshwater metagenome TaxID=449393 RepID=A0A6J7IPT4_9ZZZZ